MPRAVYDQRTPWRTRPLVLPSSSHHRSAYGSRKVTGSKIQILQAWKVIEWAWKVIEWALGAGRWWKTDHRMTSARILDLYACFRTHFSKINYVFCLCTIVSWDMFALQAQGNWLVNLYENLSCSMCTWLNSPGKTLKIDVKWSCASSGKRT